MYSEKVMDHFQNPRNMGEIENASGVGTVGNAKCGDIMRIFLDIDEGGVIREAKFKTFGCGAAVATRIFSTYQQCNIDRRDRSTIHIFQIQGNRSRYRFVECASAIHIHLQS